LISPAPLASSPAPRTNHFLAALDQGDYFALMAKAKIVDLKFGKSILHQDEPVDAVYFPLTCMFSLQVVSDERPRMELAIIGNEGIVGASEALHGWVAMGLSIIQVSGAAVRIEASAFEALGANRPHIQRLIYQHFYALVRQILYSAACNHIHSMEERCARWLLMTHDRAGTDTFPVTQLFLSRMLGVRRATVNVATGTLKQAGLIRYVRGNVTVVNRAGLESASCSCYQAITKVYSSLFSEPTLPL